MKPKFQQRNHITLSIACKFSLTSIFSKELTKRLLYIAMEQTVMIANKLINLIVQQPLNGTNSLRQIHCKLRISDIHSIVNNE